MTNGLSTSYTVNERNQLTAVAGLTCAYDADGNRTSRIYDAKGPKTGYDTDDDENQLISMATDTYYTAAANRWSSLFVYDGRQRVRKRSDLLWADSDWCGGFELGAADRSS